MGNIFPVFINALSTILKNGLTPLLILVAMLFGLGIMIGYTMALFGVVKRKKQGMFPGMTRDKVGLPTKYDIQINGLGGFGSPTSFKKQK